MSDLDPSSVEGVRRFLPTHLAKLELMQLRDVNTPDYALMQLVRIGDDEAFVVAIDHNRSIVTLAVVA